MVQYGDHFPFGDHLLFNLGIISGPEIIWGPVSLGELMTRIDVKILACSLKGSHLRSVISFTILQYR